MWKTRWIYIVEVGTVEGIGNDLFYREISVIGGRNGDVYTCTLHDGLLNYFNNSTLKGVQQPDFINHRRMGQRVGVLSVCVCVCYC